jgi:integrase/recombinase XerD
MPTINLELVTSKILKKEDGRHPIYVTVYKAPHIARKKVGAAFVHEWDPEKQVIKPKGRREHVADTIFIEDEFTYFKAVFTQLDRSGEDWVAQDVFKEEAKKAAVTFYEVAEAYLNTLEFESGTYDGAKARLEKIKRYTKKDFKISDINEAWIMGFIKHCKTKEKNKEGGIGNAKNTINQAFKFIKRIVSFSDTENKALKKLKLSRVKPLKTKLTLEELDAMAKLDINKNTIKYHARNIFLVQFYFRGMRIGDALRLEVSDITGDRLKYDASKTSVDYDMKIVPPCMDILKEYLNGKKSGYVFPLLRANESDIAAKDFKNELKNRTQMVNRYLNEIAISCGIEKRVSSHIARHSFGSIADKQLGGNLKTLQGLFGHSSRAMTEEYIRELRKTDDLDDAADQILL